MSGTSIEGVKPGPPGTENMSAPPQDQETSTSRTLPPSPNDAMNRTLGLVPAFAPLLAPTVLALTGMLFLAGWAHDRVMVRRFGLSSDMFERSLQGTLALGYVPVLIGTLGALVLMIIFWSIYRPLEPRSLPEGESWPLRVNRFVNRINRVLRVLTISLVMMTYAALVAGAFGEKHATEIAADVEAGCQGSCFRYFVKGGSVVGRVVVQDKTRTAVYSRSGLMVVNNDDIDRVVPLRPVTQTGRDFRDLLPWRS